MQNQDAELAGLIDATAAGDREAFRRFYDLTAAKVLGVALRILKDRALADDVVQDAYLKVWQNAASYSPENGRPLTWLGAIVRHRSIDILRSRREHLNRAIVDDTALATLQNPKDNATDWVEVEHLRRCLDLLSAPQRQCFLLAYHEGLSRAELATQFDRPVNTISVWLHRSAAKLRDCLGAE